MWLECGRAKACDKYPDKFCKTVLEAVRREPGCDDKARMSDEYKPGKPVRPLPIEWESQEPKIMDVMQEFNAIMGHLNMMENVSSNELYHDYDFVDDVSNKPLKKEKAIEARLLEIEIF